MSHINWSTVWWWGLACLMGLCSLLGGACWWGTCRGGGCRTSVNVGTWVQRRARGLCYLVPLPRHIGALPLIVLVAINQKLQLLMHRVRCGQRGLPARRNVKSALQLLCRLHAKHHAPQAGKDLEGVGPACGHGSRTSRVQQQHLVRFLHDSDSAPTICCSSSAWSQRIEAITTGARTD